MNGKAMMIAGVIAALVAGPCLAGCSQQTESPGEPEASVSAAISENAAAQSGGREDGKQEEASMQTEQMTVTVNGRAFTAMLEDTDAARRFARLLPLGLQMEELNGNEKYAYLDEGMTTAPANPGTIHAGDIMLFGSSCIVLFYDTFPAQYSYTPIAHLDNAEELAQVVGKGDASVSFARFSG